MLKAIYTGSSVKVTGKFVPSTKPSTYNKLCIPNLDLEKCNFNFLLQEHVATPL